MLAALPYPAVSAVANVENRPAGAPPRRPRPWGIALVVVAVLVVAAGAAWGIRGLLGDPVKGTDAAGVTTLEGSWEPYDCGRPCIGYVADGARSVTVVLPRGCPAPAREQRVRVLGRLDRARGTATYDAIGCVAAP